MLGVRIFGAFCFLPLVAVSLRGCFCAATGTFTLGRKEIGMKEILDYFQLAVSN